MIREAGGRRQEAGAVGRSGRQEQSGVSSIPSPLTAYRPCLLLPTAPATAYRSCHCLPLLPLPTAPATAYRPCHCLPLLPLPTAPATAYRSCHCLPLLPLLLPTASCYCLLPTGFPVLSSQSLPRLEIVVLLCLLGRLPQWQIPSRAQLRKRGA